MLHRPSARSTSTTVLSATLLSLCGVAHAANTAPVLRFSTVSFSALTEGQGTFSDTGDKLGVLLANNANGAYFDVDIQLGGNQGLAITGVDDSHGTWQYSTDVQDVVPPVWVDIPHGTGGVSATHALLLAFSTADYAALRFLPNPGFNTRDFAAPTITFRAWDRTDNMTPSNDATQFFNDSIGAGGLTSAYSTASATGSIAVTPLNATNHAPVLAASGQTALGAFPAVSGTTSAVRIAVLLAAPANGGAVPVSDSDTNALQGIAITGADENNGDWEYTLDGTTFQVFPSDLDDTRALLLASVSDSYSGATGMAVRFFPNPGFRGTATFTYRAWDQSQHDSVQSSGGIDVDTSLNGGSTPYSAVVRTASVALLNSAPSLSAGAVGLTDVNEGDDDRTAPGRDIASMVAFSDPDFDPEGVAITAADNTHGTWQYILDGSLGPAANWTDIGAVSASSALLLHVASGSYSVTDVSIRFVPAPGFNTAGSPRPTITLRAWDETAGSSSSDFEPTFLDLTADRAANGSASTFGATDVVLSQAVLASGPSGPGTVAHVTVPPIGLSSGNSVIYASICPSTAEGVANLTSHLAGRPTNQVRGFAWDAITQAYVELPDAPSDGLNDDTGVFIATRVDLGLDFSGTPTDFPFAIVLHPGFNFVGVPPLGTLSSFATVHQFPDDFTITSGESTITDPADIATLLGTPGGDVSTAEPFFWNGSAYVQEAALTTGAGYWLKNNSNSDVLLTRVAPQVNLPVNTGAFTGATAGVTRHATLSAASVHDRGVPPPPPGGRSAETGSATAANGSGGAKSCGLGSGVAAFASMLMLALRRRLRGGRRD